MALPSSYFKAHAGTKQEWYKEEIHGVLLENFPVCTAHLYSSCTSSAFVIAMGHLVHRSNGHT